MARHGDETEEFPQASWDAMRKAELFGITIGERVGRRRARRHRGRDRARGARARRRVERDPRPADLQRPAARDRAPRHRRDAATAGCRSPRAATACSASASARPRPARAVGHMRARLTPDGDGFRLNAYKNYVTGGHKARACLVWCRFPGSEGTKGIGAVVVDLEAPGVTVAGTHVKMGLRGDERGRARVRRRAHRARRRAAVGRPGEQRVVQDADRAHQPRALRQRRDVHRRRAGRARVRGAAT